MKTKIRRGPKFVPKAEQPHQDRRTKRLRTRSSQQREALRDGDGSGTGWGIDLSVAEGKS